MRYILIAAILCISMATKANENSLGLSLLLQQYSTDNYLLSESSGQELYSVHMSPKINYQHYNGFEKFSLVAQESIERYNISDYNAANPSFSSNYQRLMEQSTIDIGYDKSIQSTLISEFTDSGNIFQKSSSQTTATSRASWSYKLNEKNSLATNAALQTVAYDSDAYSDLTNKNAQFSFQHELTEVASINAALSLGQYKSSFRGGFPVAPQMVQGYLLCPPNSWLISDTSCAYPSAANMTGEDVNITTARGLQLGGKWSIQQRLILSFSAGRSNSRVAQHITMPITSVEFGSPIDQNVLFGGERTLYSDSRYTTANINLAYQNEASAYSLAMTRQIQPSSNGGLWKTRSIEGNYHISLSNVDWIDFDFMYKNFLTFDKEIITASSVDRNIFTGSLKYGYVFSKKLTGTISLGGRRQESNLSRKIVANAVEGALAITYTPQEWAW